MNTVYVVKTNLGYWTTKAKEKKRGSFCSDVKHARMFSSEDRAKNEFKKAVSNLAGGSKLPVGWPADSKFESTEVSIFEFKEGTSISFDL